MLGAPLRLSVYSPSCPYKMAHLRLYLCLSHLGIHAWASPGQVSVLLLACPCPNLHLWASRESLPWMCPGCYPALGSYCSSLAPLPACRWIPGYRPTPVSVIPHPTCFQVCAMPGWHAKLEVPKLWRAQWHWYVEEVVPEECITNALQEDEHTWSSPGQDVAQV